MFHETSEANLIRNKLPPWDRRGDVVDNESDPFLELRELVEQAPSLARKNLILNTFVEMTGYARKSAIQLLNHPPAGTHVIQRSRLPVSSVEVQQALFPAWPAPNDRCAQRLVPFLPNLIPPWSSIGPSNLARRTAARC